MLGTQWVAVAALGTAPKSLGSAAREPAVLATAPLAGSPELLPTHLSTALRAEVRPQPRSQRMENDINFIDDIIKRVSY